MRILSILLLIHFCCESAVAQNYFPDWAKGVIWYQIFPERFANGDLNNDPEADKVLINEKKKIGNWKVTPWTSNWFSQSEWEKNAGGNFRDHLYERRYGGDLLGVINKLDYLKNLGVEAIYINPVFDAVSLHKYDASTFHHIDINFGPDPRGDTKIISSEIPDDPSTWKWTSADKLFLQLIQEVHSRGLKLIIDGVFNHTGVQFWAFQDVVNNGEASKYKNWYNIIEFDNPETKSNEFDYDGWWGIKSLPEFSEIDNDLYPGPKQYIFHITQRWMDPDNDGDPSDGIDGWRLDVSREVPMGFWKDWSKLVKHLNPEAIIVGELWELSPDFISSNGVFDALMNYNFAYAVNDLFVASKKKTDVSDIIDRLKEIDKNYPTDNLYILQNLISGHDTERLASMFLNPDREYERDANEKNSDYNPGKPTKEIYERQKLAIAFQITYRGAPMIYYGDEVGMWGADDPHCRKPMIWDELKYEDEIITSASGFKSGLGKYKVEQNKDLLEFYKAMIKLRKENSAFKLGNLEFVYSNDDKYSFAFKRSFGDDIMIVAFNLGESLDEFTVHLDASKYTFKEILENEEGTLTSSDSNLAELQIQISTSSFKIYKLTILEK
jgi:glycosidase